jgi:hypothetical protein
MGYGSGCPKFEMKILRLAPYFGHPTQPHTPYPIPHTPYPIPHTLYLGCPKSRINHKNLHPDYTSIVKEALIYKGSLSSMPPLVFYALIPLFIKS